MKIDDLFRHEGYEATDSMDCIIIEESYAKMARLIDEVMELYQGVERLIEHDMACKADIHNYLW